jgi:hypothetical protein
VTIFLVLTLFATAFVIAVSSLFVAYRTAGLPLPTGGICM